jgi:2-iminobutanoate/2-iminopropanoate deaminase
VKPINAIHPPEGPSALGHYSPGIQAGPFLYVSGQIAVTPAGESLAQADLAAQSLQALNNMAGVVRAAGGRLEDVVKITVYLADPEGWPVFNQIYADFFKDHRPARAVVPVLPFHGGFLVEVEAVAYLDPSAGDD